MRTAGIALLVTTLAFGLAHAHTDLTAAQVKALVDASGNIVVLDVREESEFCDSTYNPPGHITGAINMPWNSGYLQSHYGELSPGDSTIVVCRSGSRSNATANYLDGVGFSRVFDMSGGMNGWQWETEACYTASVPGPTGPSTQALFLGPASPNPFSRTTEVAYATPAGEGPTHLTLSIYDSRGRLVAKVVDDVRGPGMGRAEWNGTDDRGRPAASGIYFYKLAGSGKSVTRRLVLLR